MKIVKIFTVLVVVILFYDIFFGNVLSFKIISKFFHVTPWSFVGEEYGGYKYRIYRPSDYSKNNEKYPLVIYLHGAGERGNDNKRQLYGLSYLGSGVDKVARKFQKEFPSFVYIPQCPAGSDWNKDEVLTGIVKTINKLISEYPIDPQRLYLFGYSMGGSGTYSLADKFYNTTKQPFSAIVRIAGYGSFNKDVHEVISKSYIWLHVGLCDNDIIISKVKEAYAILKEKYKNAIEISKNIESKKHSGTTTALVLNGVEIVKKTEYINLGHSHGNAPFEDWLLHKWVFAKRVAGEE